MLSCICMHIYMIGGTVTVIGKIMSFMHLNGAPNLACRL